MKKNITKTNLIILIVLLCACLFPVISSNDYFKRVMTVSFIYILLASSLNLLTGYLGLFSLGHAAFYCIGAYTAGLLVTRLGVPFWVCLVCSGVMAAFIGFLVGLATLRLSDIFLAFTTLGLSEVIRITILNAARFTGGAMGITGIPAPSIFGKSFNMTMYYYTALILVVFFIIILYHFVHSNSGRTLMSIREDEQAAKSLGIDTFRYKLITMVVSCFIAGVAGCFYAFFSRFVSADAFNINESINIISMVVIGGMGTCIGPVLGAVALVIIPEVFRFLSEYRQMIYGLALICAIVFAPKGIAGIRFHKKNRKPRNKEA